MKFNLYYKKALKLCFLFTHYLMLFFFCLFIQNPLSNSFSQTENVFFNTAQGLPLNGPPSVPNTAVSDVKTAVVASAAETAVVETTVVASDEYRCTEQDTLAALKRKKDTVSNDLDTLNRPSNDARVTDKRGNLQGKGICNDSINACDATLNGIQSNCVKLIEERNTSKDQCDSAHTVYKESHTKFNRSCGSFALGSDCKEAVIACSVCPAQDSSSEEYNCVQIHERSKCPQLAGPDLKEAQDRIEDFQEDFEELNEDFTKLNTKIVKKENQLTEDLTELEQDFSKSVSAFERGVKNSNAELEQSLRSGIAGIDSTLQQAVVAVQAELDKSLQTAHSFENSILTINKNYRKETQNIKRECRIEATHQLTAHRTQRRSAIESGALRISLSRLTQKNRLTFYQQDQKYYKFYYYSCIKTRRDDFKEAEREYKSQLRRLEQAKQLYQKQLKDLQTKLIALEKSAAQQNNDLLQAYAKQTLQITQQFTQQYQEHLTTYQSKKQQLLYTQTRVINNEKTIETALKGQLQHMQMGLVQENDLISSLRSHEVPTTENNEEYVETRTNFIDYMAAIDKAYKQCGCSDDDNRNNENCGTDKDTLTSIFEKKNDEEWESNITPKHHSKKPKTTGGR